LFCNKYFYGPSNNNFRTKFGEHRNGKARNIMMTNQDGCMMINY